MLMIIRTGTFIALPLSLNFSLAVPALGYALWHLMACSSTSFHSKTMCGFNMMLTLVHSGMVIMLTGAVACMKATLNRKSNSAREV